MSQTAYNQNMEIGKEGSLADIGDNDVLSLSNALEIPYGKFVCRDATDFSAKLPTSAADITTLGKGLGVAIAIQNNEQPLGGSAAPSYKPLSVVSCLSQGRIYVKVEEAVNAGDPVVIRHNAGGLGLGSFAKTDGADHATLANAFYITSAAINGLAVVEINK